MVRHQSVLKGITAGGIKRSLVVLALLLVTGGTAAQANMITNGGFEEGFTGWTASETGSSIYLIHSPNSGENAAVLGNKNAVLSQMLQTVPGEKYALNFWLYNSGQVPNSFQATVNGVPLYDETNISWQPYTENSFSFIADSSLTTLAFNESRGWSGNGNFYLDDVSVVPVPEPATLLLLGSGIIGLMGAGMRRKTAAA